MKVIINDQEHTVIYIEYCNGLPFHVYTIFYVPSAIPKPYWRLVSWDFFPNNGDKTDMRYYESGSGGSHKKIQAPCWVDGYTGKYWIHSDAKFRGKVKNGLRLKNPRRLASHYMSVFKTHINPFLCAEETYSREYCEECGIESVDACEKHNSETTHHP